ncbi:MAG: hydrogenase nickel incorporation protein HypB [Magnetococcales bacterium]|nr:hydrogenase nickel incorporation protein HypB [Magnetococcales bacterium]
MCQDCGCSMEHHSHTHHSARGGHHDHTHDHHHDHTHERTILLETKVMAKNAALAEQNRQWLAARSIRAINLISSPGAGKTLLLERTLELLRDRVSCAVLVGDVQTDHDARRLQGKGARVCQIETRTSCHLDAQQVGQRLPELLPDGGPERLLIIENVGNLVCPAAFDLGEDLKIALLSVTEGEDKPVKYPSLFHQAPVVVITKIDLVPHLNWKMDRCREAILQVRPDARILELSATTGAGLASWIAFLEQLVA